MLLPVIGVFASGSRRSEFCQGTSDATGPTLSPPKAPTRENAVHSDLIDPAQYSTDMLYDVHVPHIDTTDACLDIPNGRAARVGRRYLNSP